MADTDLGRKGLPLTRSRLSLRLHILRNTGSNIAASYNIYFARLRGEDVQCWFKATVSELECPKINKQLSTELRTNPFQIELSEISTRSSTWSISRYVQCNEIRCVLLGRD